MITADDIQHSRRIVLQPNFIIIISLFYSTKQYKYSDKHWYKWSWNGNDKADSTYSHPCSVL